MRHPRPRSLRSLDNLRPPRLPRGSRRQRVSRPGASGCCAPSWLRSPLDDWLLSECACPVIGLLFSLRLRDPVPLLNSSYELIFLPRDDLPIAVHKFAPTAGVRIPQIASTFLQSHPNSYASPLEVPQHFRIATVLHDC